MDKINQEADSIIFDKDEEGTPVINITLHNYQARLLFEALVDEQRETNFERDIEVHFVKV
jgi:hypothetical protein